MILYICVAVQIDRLKSSLKDFRTQNMTVCTLVQTVVYRRANARVKRPGRSLCEEFAKTLHQNSSRCNIRFLNFTCLEQWRSWGCRCNFPSKVFFYFSVLWVRLWQEITNENRSFMSYSSRTQDLEAHTLVRSSTVQHWPSYITFCLQPTFSLLFNLQVVHSLFHFYPGLKIS